MVTDLLRMAWPGATAVVVLMTLMWLVQRKTQNAAWGDVGWTFSLGIMAASAAIFGPGLAGRRLMVAGLASFWAARLGIHLLHRTLTDEHEDGRYREFRRTWGSNLQLKFLVFFEVQALSCILLSTPFLLACRNAALRFHPLEYTAAGILALSVIGEGVADAQLRRFKKNPAHKGKTCRAGLWKFSRHPNYFFEWLSWVAWALLATPAPYGWIAWACPALMLFLLLKVSGIPATEAQAVRSKGDDYRDYQRTTSAFFPWFPKKAA